VLGSQVATKVNNKSTPEDAPKQIYWLLTHARVTFRAQALHQT